MTLDPAIESLLRREAPQVLGALVRRFGRFDVAEDAVQEALLAASTQWVVDGVPENPRSWLVRVGYRRMVDLLRSEQARRRRELELGVADVAVPPGRTDDDSLTLLLLCCHPTLSPVSQVALTLRAVGGLSTREIAHAYGVSEATMGTRISRAKQQLAAAGARFTPPTASDRADRVAAVRHVLYLVFNEGYTATAGDELGRVDLAHEAIRLTRLLVDAEPTDPEAAGLLALMLLTESRRAARTDPDGRLVPLDLQDRSRWDAALVAEGVALLDSAWARPSPGPFRVQAAIAALHATPGDTDWVEVAGLYAVLEQLSPTGPVRLGRVVAVAHALGPQRGLQLLDEQARLGSDDLTAQRFHAVRAHLLDQLGDPHGAAEHFRTAASLTSNAVERTYLLEQAASAEAERQ